MYGTQIVQQDDLQPLMAKDAGELEDVLRSVWLTKSERDELSRYAALL